MSANTTSPNYRDDFGFDMTDAQYATVNVLSRISQSMITGDGKGQTHDGNVSGYSEPGNYFTTFEQNGNWIIVRSGPQAVVSVVRSDGTVF